MTLMDVHDDLVCRILGLLYDVRPYRGSCRRFLRLANAGIFSITVRNQIQPYVSCF